MTAAMSISHEMTGKRRLGVYLSVFDGVTGSHAYGTAMPGSDVDRRKVFVYPLNRYVDLERPPETDSDNSLDIVAWEIGHFARMALRGSVNAQELLWLPAEFQWHVTPPWNALVEAREAFISHRLLKAWNGIFRGYQHELDRKENPLEGQNRWKHVAHVLRFAFGLQSLAERREIVVRHEESELDILRRTRGGQFRSEAALLDHAKWIVQNANARLAREGWVPVNPDYARINDLVVKTRLEAG